MAEELSLAALLSLGGILWSIKDVGLADLNLSPSDLSLKYFPMLHQRILRHLGDFEHRLNCLNLHSLYTESNNCIHMGTSASRILESHKI